MRRAPRRVLGGLLLATALTAGVVGALPGLAAAPVPQTPASLPADLEAFQPYVGQAGCDPVAKPGVTAFQTLLMNTYRDTGTLGIVRDCGIGSQSEHKEGRAFDWAVSVNNANHVAEVQAVTDWLTAPDSEGRRAANARRFGIMYMIWNNRIWKAYDDTKGWQAYTGSDPHTNHVHFSFGWAGARKATSWWTGTVAPVDYGPYAKPGTTTPTPTPTPTPTGPTPIDDKHDALGGDTGLLGPATGPEADVLGGRYRPYQQGAIYWSAAAGAHEVHGDIARRYLGMGGSRSPLGLPLTDEVAVTGGVANTFSKGAVYWSAGTGAHSVYGGIWEQFKSIGASSAGLGLPTGEETDIRGGRVLPFQQGRMYWSDATGAHEVHGGIAQAYDRLGAENGVLGLPTADEADAPGAGGVRISRFAAGDVYWSARTGAWEVHGAVRDKWASVGGPRSVLGLPVTDEVAEPGGARGTFVYGRVYWSPSTGAHQLYGSILARYLADGGVARYGFPTSDEYGTLVGTTLETQRAYLDYDRRTGAVKVRSR